MTDLSMIRFLTDNKIRNFTFWLGVANNVCRCAWCGKSTVGFVSLKGLNNSSRYCRNCGIGWFDTRYFSYEPESIVNQFSILCRAQEFQNKTVSKNLNESVSKNLNKSVFTSKILNGSLYFKIVRGLISENSENSENSEVPHVISHYDA